ncbi:MAG: signal recognition particle protein [Deltaproteobacteria bacterium]|nr:signal recognition particle protein [Deltaproteobacteria bacterium]
MFDQLSQKFTKVLDKMRGLSRIDEKNTDDALREVRLSLLEADVHFKVVKEFTDAVKVRALGQEVMKSLTPGQMLVKIVHEELIKVLGETQEINLAFKPPVVILLAGLQGAGKTTSAAKLALYLRDKKKRTPYLVPADVNRPAAIEQLKTLADKLNIAVYPTKTSDDPVKIARIARDYAADFGYDTVIIDTAGRLHIDDILMKELNKICSKVEVQQKILVVDSMTGQEAVKVAQNFNATIPLDGVILTKTDGDARGGAALSLRHVLGKPIFFLGVGEKPTEFEQFHPDRMASRILGMGDVLSLIEQAQQNIDLDLAKEMTDRVLKKGFTLLDFQSQLGQMKKMGSLEKMAGMIPGVSKMKADINFGDLETDLKKKAAILNSMTRKEKLNPKILNGNRRLRIAKGSGTQVAEVNRLLKEFEQMKGMMDKFGNMSFKGMKQLAGRFGF